MCKDERCNNPQFIPTGALQGGGGISTEPEMMVEHPFGAVAHGTAPSRPILLAEAKVKIAASPVTRGMVALEGLPLPKLGVEQVFPTGTQIPVTEGLNILTGFYTPTPALSSQDTQDGEWEYRYLISLGKDLLLKNKKRWGNYSGIHQDEVDKMPEDVREGRRRIEKKIEEWIYPPTATPSSQDTQYWDEYFKKLYPGEKPRPVFGPGLSPDDPGWNEPAKPKEGYRQRFGIPREDFIQLEEFIGMMGKDRLLENKRRWGNYFGICGTGIVGMDKGEWERFLQEEAYIERWIREH